MPKAKRDFRDSWEELLKTSTTAPEPKKPASKQVVTGYKSNLQGWRVIGGKKYYFRSLWEMNYARFLEWLKTTGKIQDWFYEPTVFEFPKRPYKTGPFYYKPDFYVKYSEAYAEWHEVKGYMTKEAEKKTKRFRKHYPEDKLIIIDSNYMQYVAKTFRHHVPGWEYLPDEAR